MPESGGRARKHAGYDPQWHQGDLFGELHLATGDDVEASGRADPRRFLRGLVLCGTIALAATWLSEHYMMPAIVVGLLLGLALNFAAHDRRAFPGLALASNQGLKLGIVLIGFQVTYAQISEIGFVPLAALVAIMACAFGGGLIAARLSGQSSHSGILAGGATAICGASAALALYGIVGKDRVSHAQFALTLLCIALASAASMMLYPVLAETLGLSDRTAGFLIGAAVHDVAQAIGGGYSISDVAGVQATIIKLARVALLAPVVLITSLAIGSRDQSGSGSILQRLVPPWFILGFLAVASVNSMIEIPPVIGETAGLCAKAMLLLAVVATALGARTDLIRELGWRAAMPVVGATASSCIAAVAATLLFLR